MAYEESNGYVTPICLGLNFSQTARDRRSITNDYRKWHRMVTRPMTSH